MKSPGRFIPRTGEPSVAGGVARALGGDAQAYQYLPNSLKTFKSREELCESMRRAGLEDVHYHDLSGGMVCVHVGTKPLNDSTPVSA